jgi:hypothetical protein
MMQKLKMAIIDIFHTITDRIKKCVQPIVIHNPLLCTTWVPFNAFFGSYSPIAPSQPCLAS